MTREEMVKIHAAMEKHEGVIAKAARALGMEYRALTHAIQIHPELALRWGNNFKDIPPMSVEESMTRTPESIGTVTSGLSGASDFVGSEVEVSNELTTQEKALYDALDQEDRNVRYSFSKLQFSPKELEIATSMTRHNKKYFGVSLHTIGGGLVRTAIIFQAEIDFIRERLRQVQELIAKTIPAEMEITGEDGKTRKIFVGGEQRDFYVKEEHRLYQILDAMSRSTGGMFKEALNGISTIARVKMRMYGAEGSNEKPGFRAIKNAKPAPDTVDG